MQQICAGAKAGSRPEPGLPRKANPPFSGIWKPATGLRFYNPGLGRWVNRDPIEERGGLNLLAFCLNAPTLKVDADGRMALPVVFAMAKAIWVKACYDAATRKAEEWAPPDDPWAFKKHCFVGCYFNRCQLMNAPILTLIGAILHELWGGGWNADSLGDVQATTEGVAKSHSFRSCKKACECVR